MTKQNTILFMHLYINKLLYNINIYTYYVKYYSDIKKKPTRHAKKQCDWSKSIRYTKYKNTKIQKKNKKKMKNEKYAYAVISKNKKYQ